MITLNPAITLRSIQKAVVDFIAGCSLFQDIGQVDLRPGQTESIGELAGAAIMASGTGKQGLAVVIHPPVINSMGQRGGGVGLPIATIQLELFSNFELNFGANGANVEPSQMAWTLLDSLTNRQFQWLGVRLTSPQNPIQTKERIGNDGATDNNYIVTLEFYCPAGYTARVATPTASLSGDAVTLSCTTTGASIYYTTAPLGTTPAYPNATNGTPYTAPFNISQASEIFAAAYVSGLVSSEVMATSANYQASGSGSLHGYSVAPTAAMLVALTGVGNINVGDTFQFLSGSFNQTVEMVNGGQPGAGHIGISIASGNNDTISGLVVAALTAHSFPGTASYNAESGNMTLTTTATGATAEISVTAANGQWIPTQAVYGTAGSGQTAQATIISASAGNHITVESASLTGTLGGTVELAYLHPNSTTTALSSLSSAGTFPAPGGGWPQSSTGDALIALISGTIPTGGSATVSATASID